jgi:transcriptional regulator with XRE-family HTH domain
VDAASEGVAGPALAEGAADVGRRVRELRERRGMSLSELARRAAVGKATLSGLEAGTRNPTLDTLQAVGAAVQIHLLRVFDDGPVTYELYRMRVPAGLAQRSPAHQVGVTEHVTVFSGVLETGPVDDPLRAGPGEYAEWGADVPHTYAAPGPDDVLASLLIRYPRVAR